MSLALWLWLLWVAGLVFGAGLLLTLELGLRFVLRLVEGP